MDWIISPALDARYMAFWRSRIVERKVAWPQRF